MQALAKTAALPPKGDGDGKPRKSSAPGSRKKKEPPRPSLGPDEVAAARAANTPYDMRRKYAQGEHFVHPRFGVGRVERVTPEGAIEVIFEDASIRRMVHARA